MRIVRMDESVRLDLTDIEDHMEYRDQKCEELEDILRKDSRFEGCIVKRIRLQKEAPELKDPFDIQKKDGTHSVWLNEWEFDILSEPEILSYLDVQRKKEEVSDSYACWWFLGFMVIMTGACSVVALFLMYMIGIGELQFVFEQLPTAVVGLVLGLLLVYITSRRKRIGMIRRDIESARENPLFISALRKLATLSGVGNKDKDRYANRLREIEDSHLDGG